METKSEYLNKGYFSIRELLMKYWINSNSGDFICERDGEYQLHLIHRYQEGVYLPYEIIHITPAQFSSLKGFIPIKGKKLFSRTAGIGRRDKWAPTLSDGTKGQSSRVEVSTIEEVREGRLKSLGL